MSRGNQKTLFQTWGAGVPEMALAVKKVSQRRTEVCQGVEVGKDTTQEDLELDDAVMFKAAYETEKSIYNCTESATDDLVQDSTENLSDFSGYDRSSGKVWIFPTNFPVRDYQLKMSEAALFQNTLVCLPTGLGKTFIASVVMYNLYRWYPSGKIVFMAPTKPLVAQQIEACYKVMGIPQQHMAELTGSTPALQRRELWRSKRVFFLTPQVMVNDLSRNICPGAQVKCVVVDEAHKALGNHAYCQVVRQLWNQTKQFRVLALSATPGGDIKAVQQIVSNLLVSHIELRSEESPDIQAHCHQRSVEKLVVPLGKPLTEYQARYLQVLEKFTFRLTQMRVLKHHDLRTLTKYQLILAREQFRRNPPPHIMGAQHGTLEGDFALCISLYHGYELLQQMGLRSLFLFLQNIMLDSKELTRARNELQRSTIFMTFYKEMEAMFLTFMKGPEEQYFYSHPKLHKLDEVVLQHFSAWSENSGSDPGSGDISEVVSTRVMIFSSFRESVQEIAEMLNRHQPLIRVMTFMGQASARKGVRGFTQKEQLEVVQRFRDGRFNTLVSTCVGEEGLDIGEVDLIICFDAQKSPIRLVQRMGRTGRHRQGRIVIILAEGREERTYNQSQSNRNHVNKCIMGNKHSLHMFPHSPRMVPTAVTPTLHKMHITCGNFEPKNTSRCFIKDSHLLPRGRLLFNLQAQVPAVGDEQDRVKEDGFLSPAEQAVWASTMKLQEDEPQLVLRQSSFLFLSADHQLPDMSMHNRVRDLSLWEWRHWQNQPLPIHRVEHSNRCFHFTAIMDLIDRMKLGEEVRHKRQLFRTIGGKRVDCRYESELICLHKEGVVDCKEDGSAPVQISGKSPRQRRSKDAFVGQDIGHPILTANSGVRVATHKRENEKACPVSFLWTSGAEFEICPVKECLCASQCICDNPVSDMSVVQVMSADLTKYSNLNLSQQKQLQSYPRDPEGQMIKTNPHLHCNLQQELSENSTTEKMFYLPKWNVCPKTHPLKHDAASLKLILSNVKHFLSRSPRKCCDTGPALFNEPKNIHHCPVVGFSLKQDQISVAGDSSNSDMANVLHDSPNTPDIYFQSARFADQTLFSGPGSTFKSPIWDVFFDDGLDEADKKVDLPLESKKHLEFTSLEESVDLFGDDEAFLQVSLSETETLNKNSVTPKKDIQQRRRTTPGVISNNFKVLDSSRSLKMPHSLLLEKELGYQQNSEDFAYSQDIFSVNFDLGFSFDSEEETAEQALDMTTRPVVKKKQTFTSFTLNSATDHFPVGCVSTPRVSQRETISSLMVNTNLSPITTERKNLVMRSNASMLTPAFATPKQKKKENVQKICSSQTQSCERSTRSFIQSLLQSREIIYEDPACSGQQNSDSEEEVVIKKKKGQVKMNLLSSPEAKICHDEESHFSHFTQKAMHSEGRQFLDMEAELSEGGTGSSDECDEVEDQSLQGFVVDTTQFSQGLNDSEMQGFYLKSVKSPAISNKFKLVYKALHNREPEDIFSQVPEQDETDVEDSFVVSGSEDEVSSFDEDEDIGVVISPEDTYIDGRRMYATRRRVQLRQAGTEMPRKIKRSRIIRVEDSSDDEEKTRGTKIKRLYTLKAPVSERPTETGSKTSPIVKGCTKQAMQHQKERMRQKLSEKWDFQEPPSTSADKIQAESSSSSVADGPVVFAYSNIQAADSETCGSILVDSRCIISGADVVSALRLKHGVAVQVCSLMNCDFIVSNRMAVEWQSESEVASPQSRKRLQKRIQNLQALFDRVCFIVEKEHTKPGEKFFQRSPYYDSAVTGLVRAGIRLLVSQGPEDTAALLAELAQAELRKGKAISVPLEVKGPQQQALKFYLTVPCVTYINALYMCHSFSSVGHLVRSSVDSLQAGACLSRCRAEEIYHCLHYPCDITVMKINTSKKNM
ncbi:Fanconi anemia group M protein isoform X2 [Salminus brasiliensis]|uniref:Fanconi anemia group M protein isoform X2 n=1 Tax=Salminus brasiliensis TaxID=930266 RepID=UPI003B832CB0